MKGYTRGDIQWHTDRPYGLGYPAVNVKVRNFAGGLGGDELAEQFKCSEEVAEQALEFAWNCACRSFWQDGRAEDIVEHYFGKGHKWYGAGRSGGWLIVTDIGDPEDWGGVEVNRWALFERAIQREADFLMSREMILEDITANRWAEEGAQEFNFIDGKDGTTSCVVDLKHSAAAKLSQAERQVAGV